MHKPAYQGYFFTTGNDINAPQCEHIYIDGVKYFVGAAFLKYKSLNVVIASHLGKTLQQEKCSLKRRDGFLIIE
ncbi:hypothetical protein P5673_002224 [Acropora cervicornis]|uniref:Uncharacterized protein n=1 Tax=Acropora cervicornis TaxID=6130 RepID=A0AAD9R507_ACRCE|nr:hypothetical protein P5673_002224 [Acropora cervicornis]